MMKHSKRLLDWSVDHLRVKIKTINTDVCARVCIRWCIIFFSIYSHSHNTYTCSIPSTGFFLFVSLQKSKVLLAKRKLRAASKQIDLNRIRVCLSFIVVGLKWPNRINAVNDDDGDCWCWCWYLVIIMIIIVAYWSTNEISIKSDLCACLLRFPSTIEIPSRNWSISHESVQAR